MTFLWKFEADIRTTGARFHLEEDIPFFGNYQQAQAQAKERQARWEQNNHQSIDHVELLFSITPDKQQVPASLLKLAGYALAGVIKLGRADEKMSHNIIILEKDGRRKTDTIQSGCWKKAAEIVQSYLRDATQKKLYDICVMAYNGALIDGAATDNAFICRMYTGDLSGNRFVHQIYQPSTETLVLSITGAPGLILNSSKIEGRSVWSEILMEGCLQHAKENNDWYYIDHINNDWIENQTPTPPVIHQPDMLDRVVELLHKDTSPDTRLYAVVDGAKAADDDELRTILNQPGIQKTPLFTYELAPGEFDLSPCLIRLDHHQEIKNQLIIRGWGKKWNLFLTSDADTETLSTHLKIILHPRTDSGRPVIFRFYDPTILADYLPLLAPEESAGFFGPVKRFIFESENGRPQEFKRPRDVYDPTANYVHLLDHEKEKALRAAWDKRRQ